jgi:hypothetical protein
MKFMSSLRAVLAVSVLVMAAMVGLMAWEAAGEMVPAVVAGGLVLFVAGNLLAAPSMEGRLCVTLTSTEILMDIIQAFTKWFPGLNRMGTEFRPGSLKLNQQYIAHIPSIPTVEDVSTTYALTGQTARSLLSDVPITVDKHKAVLLKWSHFDAIKDQKTGDRYTQVVGLAGYALAKAVVDDILAGVSAVNFSQSSTFATADCDLDMLNNVCEDMNGVGALPVGRFMLVNSAVATTLGADSRIASRDYHGQQQGGNALRRFLNVAGFEEIFEYADFPSNNGSAVTSATAEADDDLITKASHGLVTGQRVRLTALTNGTGLTLNDYYYVIRVSSSTLKLATTRANAIAGTGVDITADGTGITLTPAENLVAAGFDRRAISFLAGIPDNFDQAALASQLGVPQIMAMEAVTEPMSGVTMAAVKWQDAGTGQLNFAPTLVWGKALGAQAGAAGTLCDYAGHRVISA